MKNLYRKDWKTVIFWSAVAVGVFTVGYWTQTVFPTLQPGDKGTWAGAIGTFFTLIGTIILATSESRRRHRAENALARLSCWNLYPRLIRTQNTLDLVLRRLTNSLMPEVISSECARCAEQLARLTLWTVDELIPIASLPRNTASGLATVAENLKHIRASLENLAARASDDLTEDILPLITLLNMSKESLNYSMLECQRTMEA